MKACEIGVQLAGWPRGGRGCRMYRVCRVLQSSIVHGISSLRHAGYTYKHTNTHTNIAADFCIFHTGGKSFFASPPPLPSTS
jgi:hypothetical protein